MNKEEIEKAINELPHIGIDNKRPISAYNSVDIRVIQECIDSMNNNVKTYIELAQENIQLKEKYLNAVADYEYEKSKNNKAIEYLNTLECLHIGIGENEYNLEKMYGSTKNYVEDLLEILKGDSNEN